MAAPPRYNVYSASCQTRQALDRIADKWAALIVGLLEQRPRIPDGLSGLGAALQAMPAQGVALKYDRIHAVLGEGNFVLSVSEGTLGGGQSSFYDLFRVANGKIAGHWDTIEPIAAREHWKSGNGKFGF